MLDTVFEANRGREAGAILMSGPSSLIFALTNVTFSNNVALKSGGGAIRMSLLVKTATNITRCAFLANKVRDRPPLLRRLPGPSQPCS